MTKWVVALLLAASASISFAQQTGTGGAGAGSGSAALPTATSVGQVLAATTLPNTYSAVVNPGLLNFPNLASATTPLYLETHFRDDTTQAFMSYSADAQNYVQLDATPVYNGGGAGIRDIGAVYVPAQAKFYYMATTNGGSGPSYSYFTSTDLQTFTGQTAITVGSTATSLAWSPHPFLDTNTGNYYVVVSSCATTCTTATGFYIAQWTPATNTYGSWAPITLSSNGTTTGLFDARIYWNAANSTYYMVYCNQNGAGQNIYIATASTVTGPYTRINTGTTDFFGFGNLVENPDLILLPNGKVRIQADVWQSLGGSRWYSRTLVDTSSNFTVVSSPAQLLNGPEQEGGTNITITTPTVAALVYIAAEIQPNPVNFPLAKIGVNGAQNSAYSIFLNNFAFAGFPNSFNSVSPPAIGFQNATGGIATISPGSLGPSATLNVGTFPGDNSGIIEASTFYLAGSTATSFISGAANYFNVKDNQSGNFSLNVFEAAGVIANGPGTNIMSTGGYQWSSATSGVGNVDTGLWRPAANTVSVGTFAAQTGGLFEGAGLIHTGTKFSVTGCGTATSLIGGSTAGQFTGGSATCSPVITTNVTAPNGYSCSMQDQTTSTAVFRETANTTTTVTFTGSGTIGATDVINFSCSPF